MVLSPLPRYLWNRRRICPTLFANNESPRYAAGTGATLYKLTTRLRNMIFMRKLKEVSSVNTVEVLEIIPSTGGTVTSEVEILVLWGFDPVSLAPAV
jgi:hypothetical protein